VQAVIRCAVALALTVAGAGCVRDGAFRCTSDADCVLSGVQGRCEPVLYCSFPDSQCNGNRFGEHAGSYAGSCVGNVDQMDASVDMMTDVGPDAGPAFFDDFSGGASQWLVLSGTWAVVSGAYEQSSNAYGPFAVAGGDWSDLTVQASIVIKSGNDDIAHLAFRVVDENNYVAGFISKFYTAVGIEQIINGTRTFTQSTFAPSFNQTYVVKVVVSGLSTMIYVNNVLAHSRTLPAGGPASGKIGLRTNAADVTFDDVSVTIP